MGKFKIVDKNDKHYLGRASANIEEIKNKFRNRIIAGVCLTLIVGSSLGAVYETIDYINEDDNKEIVYESERDDPNTTIACIRVESEVHDKVNELDKVFDGFSEEDYQEYKDLYECKNEFNELKNEIKGVNVLPQNKVFESKMVRIRDELTELFDNINDFIKKMEEDKKKFKEMLELDKKKKYKLGERPKDEDYKEKGKVNTNLRL